MCWLVVMIITCIVFYLDDGKLKWKYETQNYVNGAPGIADGKIYFGGCDAGNLWY